MRPLQAHCRRSLGTLYAKCDQRAQARTEPGAACDLYQAMTMTFWLPQVEAVLAQVELIKFDMTNPLNPWYKRAGTVSHTERGKPCSQTSTSS